MMSYFLIDKSKIDGQRTEGNPIVMKSIGSHARCDER